MHIEVTVSEIFDRLSILDIKKQNGLNVEIEYEKMRAIYNDVVSKNKVLEFYYPILKIVNEQMWCIEDLKRQHEETKNFDTMFIDLSRSIYMINDERARIKRIIDTLANSVTFEQKKHREYL
jgi:hypothetical protein